MKRETFSLNTNRALRFRRWSRKASAVFHSLHATVAIGSLSLSVVRSLEKKTAKVSKLLGLNSENTFVNNTEEANEDIAFASLSIGELCQILGITLEEKCLCSAEQKPYATLRQTTIQGKQTTRSAQGELGSLLSLLIYQTIT